MATTAKLPCAWLWAAWLLLMREGPAPAWGRAGWGLAALHWEEVGIVACSSQRVDRWPSLCIVCDTQSIAVVEVIVEPQGSCGHTSTGFWNDLEVLFWVRRMWSHQKAMTDSLRLLPNPPGLTQSLSLSPCRTPLRFRGCSCFGPPDTFLPRGEGGNYRVHWPAWLLSKQCGQGWGDKAQLLLRLSRCSLCRPPPAGWTLQLWAKHPRKHLPDPLIASVLHWPCTAPETPFNEHLEPNTYRGQLGIFG